MNFQNILTKWQYFVINYQKLKIYHKIVIFNCFSVKSLKLVLCPGWGSALLSTAKPLEVFWWPGDHRTKVLPMPLPRLPIVCHLGDVNSFFLMQPLLGHHILYNIFLHFCSFGGAGERAFTCSLSLSLLGP